MAAAAVIATGCNWSGPAGLPDANLAGAKEPGPAGPPPAYVADTGSQALAPPWAGEARLAIKVAFPRRSVQIIPEGTSQVVMTLSGGSLTQPIVATVTPPPPPQVEAQRLFVGLKQGQGYSLVAEARNAGGVVLAKGTKSDLALFSGTNAVALEMALAGAAGRLDF